MTNLFGNSKFENFQKFPLSHGIALIGIVTDRSRLGTSLDVTRHSRVYRPWGVGGGGVDSPIKMQGCSSCYNIKRPSVMLLRYLLGY